MVPRIPIVLALCAAALVVVPVSAGQADDAGLAAQWHLDEQAVGLTADSSGHGLDGALTGGATLVPGGRFANALDLPTIGSAGSRVDVADSPALESPAITVLAWVKASGPGAYKWMLAKGAQNCLGPSYGLTTGPSGGLEFAIFDGAGSRLSPDAGAAIWDDQWHAVAGTYDGTALRLYVDGAQVGAGTPTAAAVAYNLQFEDLNIGNYPGSVFCAFDYTFPGLIDEARVYTRALDTTEIAYLQRADHVTPPSLPVPGPGEAPPAEPAPAPTPEPPAVTAITPVRPPAAGQPLVLTVTVAGKFDQIQWNLRGDRTPEIVSGPGQTAVSFRPAPGNTVVTAQAVGPGGAGPVVSHAVTTPPPPKTGVAAAVEAKLATREPVFVAGPPDALKRDPAPVVGQRPELRLCSETLVAGPLEIDGCMNRITSVNDIPKAERGIVTGIAQQLGVSLTTGAVQTAIGLSDAYFTHDTVKINGVRFTPAPGSGAAIVIYPQINRIVSSNASVDVGGIKLDIPPSFSLDTTALAGRIHLGTFHQLPGGITTLARFGLVGDVTVDLVHRRALRGTPYLPSNAEITVSLEPPDVLKAAGVAFRGLATLTADNAHSLNVDSLKLGPVNATVGEVSIQNAQLTYQRVPNEEWRGTGKACMPGGLCLDMTPPHGDVTFRHGLFYHVGATLGPFSPRVTLFPGLDLESIGFGFGLDPTRFTGSARVVAAGVVTIDGVVLMAFPSQRTPYVLDRDEVGTGFPAAFYGPPHTGPTVGMTAAASIDISGLSIPFGQAYFLYEYPGYVAFGGAASMSLADVISVHGQIAGEFNAANGRFNLEGSVEGCIDEVDICAGFHGGISDRGMAFCGSFVFDMGVGIQYHPFHVTPYLAGCSFDDYRETHVKGRSARALIGSPYLVHIDPGDPNRSIRIDGADGAPAVRVTGPDGETVESTQHLTTGNRIAILRAEKLKTTVVGLRNPRPGTYRIEQLPDSVPVTKISEAQALPAAKATSMVSGSGTERELRYDIRTRAGQTVTFLEVTAGGGARTIGTVTGGGRGTLRFSSAPGPGVRQVEAQFTLNGLPAERLTVARFAAPSPRLSRPQRLRVVRRGTSLHVSWHKVLDATSYEVAVTTSSSGQRLIRTRSPSAAVSRIARSNSGRVAVRAVATLRAGSPALARFRATVPRPTQFGKLSKAPKLR